MVSGTISEPQFLLTELKYTLGQLHVQVLDLERDTRHAEAEGQSIESILSDLLQSETRYQERYADMLNISTPKSTGVDAEIPLPVASEDVPPSREVSFERLRAQTIAMLQTVPEPWSQELLDLVKEQVTEDRKQTTAIADRRRTHLEEVNRPELQEPLTDTLPHK